MKKHYYIIFAVILLIAGVSIGFYVNMGGFEKPSNVLIETPKQILIAQHYKGSVKNKDFAHLFTKAADLVKQGTLKGTLVAYYINNPDKGDGTADAYVGIILSDTSKFAIPGAYEKIEIPARKVIQTTIKAHFAVASNIYKEATTFAKEQKLKIKDVEVLEIYPSDKEFILQTPVL